MYEAYAAVERAYSLGRYDTALQQAQALLATLDATPDASADEPLRPRLLLLMGHCHLYGLADPQQAAAAYRDVLKRCNEPVLREIAEESLGRCTTNAPAPASEPSQAASAATPWLEQSTSTSTSKATSAQPAAARPQAELPLQALPQQLAAIKPQPLAAQEPQAQAEPEPEPQVEPTPEPEPKPELIIPELVSEPEAPARPSSSFSPEEEEDLARGLLLVEL